MKKKLLVLLFTLASSLCLSLGLAGCDFGSGAHTHSYTESVVAPTCTEQGYTLHTCSCGDSYTDTYTAALGHDYEDGYCTVCGARAPSEGLALTLSSGGTYYTVTGIGTCTDTDVVIPSEYKGLPVTAIGAQAFDNNTDLTGITIPDSVASIGDDAFYGCSSLTYNEYENAYYLGNDSNPYLVLVETTSTSITSCTIHENTKIIYSQAFYNCTSLTSITIPENVTSIGSYAFYNCKSLTSITIPDGVTSIDYDTFEKCTNLLSITIPDSVTSIGDYAFENCTSLTSITIPDSVTSIGGSAFSGCTSLTEIYYNATECADLTVYNGVFSHVGQSGEGITVYIGANVKSIPAFLFCSYNSYPKIVSVVFAEGSVCTRIRNYAFYGCTSLTTVYYGGSAEDWSAITFESYNTYLINATRYYYSEEEPTEEGNYWRYVDGEIVIWGDDSED